VSVNEANSWLRVNSGDSGPRSFNSFEIDKATSEAARGLYNYHIINCPKRIVNFFTDNYGRWAPAINNDKFRF
jgi:hypothetical protein